MSGRRLFETLRHLNYVSLSVPVGIIVANAIFTLQPVIQQAFIAIMLVWFGVEMMTSA
jgi:hypothetical protein